MVKQSAFPFIVETDTLYGFRVVSQQQAGARSIIYQGPEAMARFVAIACNRMSVAEKARFDK